MYIILIRRADQEFCAVFFLPNKIENFRTTNKNTNMPISFLLKVCESVTCQLQHPTTCWNKHKKKEVKNQNHWKLFSCFFFSTINLYCIFYSILKCCTDFFCNQIFCLKLNCEETRRSSTRTRECVCFWWDGCFFSSNNKNETYSMFYKIIIMIVCVCVFLSP